ncbi:unnamed protein product [Closterium sp. NIES-54]
MGHEGSERDETCGSSDSSSSSSISSTEATPPEALPPQVSPPEASPAVSPENLPPANVVHENSIKPSPDSESTAGNVSLDSSVPRHPHLLPHQPYLLPARSAAAVLHTLRKQHAPTVALHVYWRLRAAGQLSFHCNDVALAACCGVETDYRLAEYERAERRQGGGWGGGGAQGKGGAEEMGFLGSSEGDGLLGGEEGEEGGEEEVEEEEGDGGSEVGAMEEGMEGEGGGEGGEGDWETGGSSSTTSSSSSSRNGSDRHSNGWHRRMGEGEVKQGARGEANVLESGLGDVGLVEADGAAAAALLLSHQATTLPGPSPHSQASCRSQASPADWPAMEARLPVLSALIRFEERFGIGSSAWEEVRALGLWERAALEILAESRGKLQRFGGEMARPYHRVLMALALRGWGDEIAQVHAWMEQVHAWMEQVHAWMEQVHAWMEQVHAWMEQVHAWMEQVHAWMEQDSSQLLLHLASATATATANLH